MTSVNFDAIIQRLQNVLPWNIYWVTPTGDVEPWFEVTGGIAEELVLYETSLQEQVQVIGGKIMDWGRYAAQARRVWQIEERKYRIWRDKTVLSLLDPVTKPDGWKRPTEKQTDCIIRNDPEYIRHYQNTERAEEAYNCTVAVLDGFRAQKDMMKAAIIKSNEFAAPRLNV